MTARLCIELAPEAPERCRADVLVVGLFEAERPLRGPVGRADWRLCGLLSRLVADGLLGSSPGDASLVATSGRLAAARVLVLGVGQREAFAAASMTALGSEAASRLLALRARHAALAPPGEERTGLASDVAAQALAQGAGEAVRAEAKSLELALVCDAACAARTRRGLEAARAALSERGVVLEVRQRQAPPAAEPWAGTDSAGPP